MIIIIGDSYHNDGFGDFKIKMKIQESINHPVTKGAMEFQHFLYHSKEHDFYVKSLIFLKREDIQATFSMEDIEKYCYQADAPTWEDALFISEIRLEDQMLHAIRDSMDNTLERMNSKLDERALSGHKKILDQFPRLVHKMTSNYKLNRVPQTFNLILGKAGVGKTYFIQKFVEKYQENIVIVAPTAMAAINIGGATINSFFGLPLDVFDPNDPEIIKHNLKFSSLDYLIIDEISMVKSFQLDAIDKIMRANNDNNEPFGGKTLIAFGDLYQLGPISSDDTEANQFMQDNYNGSYWFFDSKAMKRHFTERSSNGINDISVMVESKRQKDKLFLSFLDVIRRGKSLSDIENQNFLNVSNVINDNESRDNTVYLCQTNDQAKQINQDKLNQLKGNLKVYIAKINNWPEGAMKYPNEVEIKLKVSAEVIFVKNDNNKKYYNGEKGVVEELGNDIITVRKSNDNIVEVQPTVWEKYKYTYNSETKKLTKEVIATFTQLPIRLGWAITIAKSQGMTIEHISLDLSRPMFAKGMLYTAFSRVREAKDIHVTIGSIGDSILQTPDHRVETFVKEQGIEKV